MKENYQIKGFNVLWKVILLLVNVPLIGYGQVKVEIDKTIQFQKIDGFGAFEQNTGALDKAYVNLIINDLGATIVRNLIPADIEPANENNDPFNTDLSKFKWNTSESDPCKSGGGPFSARVQAMKDLKAEADAKGEPLKFILSCWSPPAWMKYVKCTFGTDATWNRLITTEQEALYGGTAEPVKDRKDELAEYFYAVVKYLEQQGIDLYALSIQNELAFGQPYPACVYDPKVYPKVLSAVGKRFRDNGINTKFFYPEDIGDLGRFAQYINGVLYDPEAINYADIGAVHAYAADAVTAGSQDARIWDGMFRVVNRKKPTPFWQTETSGYGTDYNAAMKIAKAMYIALRFGKVSAWVFWGFSHPNPTEGLMAADKVPTSRFYVSKNFYRYVRPGAISVSATSTDSTVLSLAFQHNEKKTLSVVLINIDPSKSKTVNLNFASNSNAPTSYKKYVTASNKNCVMEGTVGVSSITLPPNSVTTLVGEGSAPLVLDTQDEQGESETSQFAIFPNPANEEFYIERKNRLNESFSVIVTDFNGKTIKEKTFKGVELEIIKTNDLTNGLYFVKIVNAKGEILTLEKLAISK